MGFVDWLTTVLGVAYLGAVEINPLFAGMVNSNILVFSCIKLSAAILSGFLFYKGYAIEKTSRINSHLGKLCVGSGYFASLTTLTVVAANNIATVVSLL
jgi:membrane protein DedA with SNARE-associated domain